MAKQNEHGRLIAAAAKAALAPLGCQRKGQSRVWIADQRYWAILIEFQPSSWEKGTYLNVWPQWLWLRLGGGHMNVRVGDFIAFRSAEQFMPLIADLAAQAAARVQELRSQFQYLSDIYSYLTDRMANKSSRIYAAAATAGLVGDIATSRRLFDQIEMLDDIGFDPWIKLKTESTTLVALLDDPVRYRTATLAVIEDFRRQLRLPPDPQCLEATDATSAQ